MINGLDLFSGIGGLSEGLKDYVRPVAYCESDRYAQGVLCSRMRSGQLPIAPIWPDVRTLDAEALRGHVDIVYGGFPCQDISAAGAGRGLAGERSGLYTEIEKVVRVTQPTFVFLENVPAIRTRGLGRVVWGFSELGYDLRWTVVSAAETGAPHLRKRWFMLAHARSQPLGDESRRSSRSGRKSQIEPRHDGRAERVADSDRKRRGEGLRGKALREGRPDSDERGPPLANADRGKREIERLSKPSWIEGERRRQSDRLRHAVANAKISPDGQPSKWKGRPNTRGGDTDCRGFDGERGGVESEKHWSIEPDVGRVAHGISYRVDRLRCLGNAVVPAQSKAAFERLLGLT